MGNTIFCSSRKYTRFDLFKMKEERRVIILANGKVYDFTEYTENNSHPGSNEIIYKNIYTDCSEHFSLKKV